MLMVQHARKIFHEDERSLEGWGSTNLTFATIPPSRCEGASRPLCIGPATYGTDVHTVADFSDGK
jgi:hypothetical protein